MNQAKRRHGFTPRPDARRTYVLKIRLRLDEKQCLLDRAKQRKMALAGYVREAALDRLPPIIPEINHNCWLKLSPISANLNQLSRHINAGNMPEMAEIQRLFSEFRGALIGVSSANSDRVDAEDEVNSPVDAKPAAPETPQKTTGGDHEGDE